MMVNETNINKFKAFAGFKYSSNGRLNTIQINHVVLRASDVQHNDDLYFVVFKPNNGNVFNLVEMNNRSKAMVIHVPMFLKWLLVIQCCLKLLAVIYYNINSTKLSENNYNEVYHENTMFVNFIDGNLVENVIIMTLAICIVELTIDKVVIFALLEHLFYLGLYSLIIRKRVITYYTQKLSKLRKLW